MTGRADWYLTRSTGTVALLLLTAIVVLGVLGPLRVGGAGRWPRFVVGSLHRDLSLLALAVLAIHITTSVLDSYAPIGWLDAIVPFRSAYRSVWLGLGAAAFDLLLAVIVTSVTRRRLGYRPWRRIHWFAYACWPLAVAHGLGTGSDAASNWMTIITLGCIATTAGAVLTRVTQAPALTGGRRALALVAPPVTAVAILGFALAGPWRAGWAARAGTPSSLLHRASTVAARPRRFLVALTGHERERAAPGGALVDLSLALQGAYSGVLRIRLAGHPVREGISLVGSQVDLSSRQLGGVFQGPVTHLDGELLEADLRQVGRAGWRVSADVQINPATGVVAGRLAGSALA